MEGMAKEVASLGQTENAEGKGNHKGNATYKVLQFHIRGEAEQEGY